MFIITNLILAATYLWGVEHNRLICAALWVIAPMVNIVLLGLKEKLSK